MNIFEENAKEIEELNRIDSTQAASLGSTVKYYLSLKKEIKDIEKHLKEKKIIADNLERVTLPELMQQVDCLDFKSTSGERIVLKDIITASIPSATAINKATGEKWKQLVDRKNACIEWLRQNKKDNFIKSIITIDVGKDEDLAHNIIKTLEKINVSCSVDETVHPQTLISAMKSFIDENLIIPKETFNLYQGKIVKITK